MKNVTHIRLSLMSLVRFTIKTCGLLIVAAALSARADLTWDSTTSTADGQVDGSGTWSTTGSGNLHWWNGATNVLWTQGENAIIGVGNGAAAAITPGVALTVGNLTFNAPGSGSYSIKPSSSGNKLTTSGTITVADTVTASIEMGIAGGGFTKAGNGTLRINGTTTGHANTYSGVVTVSAGTLELNHGPSYANITGDLTIASNATVRLIQNTQTATTTTVTVNGTFDVNGRTNTIGTLNGAGPVTLGAGILTAGAGTYTGSISGTGGLAKNGVGTLTLGGAVSYTGTTLVSGGTLVLAGSSLATSLVINVGTGGTLDTSGAGLTLATGQNLRGGGTILGATTVGDGATLTPGNNGIGALSFSSTLALLGNSTTTMELNKTTGSNDVVHAVTSIAYGGSLTVNNIGGDQTGGEIYKLFDAPLLTGTFTNVVLPTLPAGLSWNNTLNTDGSISIVGGVTPPPPSGQLITSAILLPGTGIVLSGTGGTNSGPFTVFSSTSISSSLATWATGSTGTFDGSGNFSITNAVTPAAIQEYFIIHQP